MRRICLWLLLLAGLTACASSPKDDQEQVSSLPWNRPQKWEGQGQMGGMMQ